MKLKDYLDREYPTPYNYFGDLTYVTEQTTDGFMTTIILKTEGWFKYNNKCEISLDNFNQSYTISLCDTDVVGNLSILEKTFKTKVEKIKKLMLELNTL